MLQAVEVTEGVAAAEEATVEVEVAMETAVRSGHVSLCSGVSVFVSEPAA